MNKLTLRTSNQKQKKKKKKKKKTTSNMKPYNDEQSRFDDTKKESPNVIVVIPDENEPDMTVIIGSEESKSDDDYETLPPLAKFHMPYAPKPTLFSPSRRTSFSSRRVYDSLQRVTSKAFQSMFVMPMTLRASALLGVVESTTTNRGTPIIIKTCHVCPPPPYQEHDENLIILTRIGDTNVQENPFLEIHIMRKLQSDQTTPDFLGAYLILDDDEEEDQSSTDNDIDCYEDYPLSSSHRSPPHVIVKIVSRDGGPDMFRHVDNLSQTSPIVTHPTQIMLQMARIIQKLHSMRIAHCDVSLENFVMMDYQDSEAIVRIIDFAIAYIGLPRDGLHIGLNNKESGKKTYFSKDRISGAPYNVYDEDVHALAVCFFMMLTALPPYNANQIHLQRDMAFQMWNNGKVVCLLVAYNRYHDSSVSASIYQLIGDMAKGRTRRIEDVVQTLSNVVEGFVV
jgi:hypothetical protein